MIGRFKMGKAPVKRISKDTIVLNVWENEVVIDGKNVKIPNFTLSRMYKDNGSDNWKYTANFRDGDLQNIIRAIEEYQGYEVMDDDEICPWDFSKDTGGAEAE